MSHRAALGLPGATAVGMVAVMAVGSPVASQESVTRLGTACAVGAAALANQCLELALAAQAAHGLVGLGAAGGTELSGSSSTLGRRFGSTPRFGLGVRGGFIHASMPGSLAAPLGESADKGVLAWVVDAAAVIGVFNGFSLAPTVGGILSVDLVATATRVSGPGDRGFQGPVTGFGLGVRVGAFRESFTLPGVTVSAARRWLGEHELGRASVDNGEAAIDQTVTSLRATVGKDLLGFGVFGGLGWDRYRSDVTLEAIGFGENDGLTGTATDEPLQTDRTLFFAGLGYTVLIYQFSAETGYAAGFDQVEGRSGGYDPSSGAFFLKVAFRLTL